jgi:hypothetical protein
VERRLGGERAAVSASSVQGGCTRGPSKAMGRQGRRNGTGRRRGASRATTGDVVVCLGVPVLGANGRGLNGLGPSFGRVVFVQTGAKIDGAAWPA